MIALSRLLLLAAALLLTACGSPAPRPDYGPSRVALWELSGPHGERAWIFGTIHALPADVEWQRPAVRDALTQADRLMMEIGGEVDPAAAADILQRLGTSPGPSLPDPLKRVAPAQQATFAAALKHLDIDPARFARTESWSIALQMAALAGRQNGATASDGVEQALRKAAGQRPIIGLETLEGQFTLFDRLPPNQQAHLLEQTAAEIVSNRDEERDLLRLWLAGDDAAIARETSKGLLSDAELRKVLLVNRNKAWVERIEALLNRGARPFIAVGAAHVAGPDGLPAMLAKRGWMVRRVP